MDWLVSGTRGGKPGRWKLEAADESAAREKAVAGGVAVQEVRRYPVAQVAAEAPATVGSTAVGSASAVPSAEHSGPEPEAPEDESPVDSGDSAAAEREPSASDELPAEANARDESAALTPVSAEIREAPAAKSSARSTGSTGSTGSTSSPQASSSKSSSKQSPKRRKSLWGIAAIAAGVVGAIAGFIAPARIAAIPLSSAGLLLAIAGIYFSLKRKRSGLLLPAIGVVVCAAAISLLVYSGHQQGHEGHQALTVQEQLELDRAERAARSNIGVQLISVQPASGDKYSITFAYKCLANGMSVTQIAGRLTIMDASGKEIETLGVFETFPQPLGANPVQRESRWTLTPDIAKRLQADTSQLKVEFDPSGIR